MTAVECAVAKCGPCESAVQSFGDGADRHRGAARIALAEFDLSAGVCPEQVLSQLSSDVRAEVGMRMANLMPYLQEVNAGGAQ